MHCLILEVEHHLRQLFYFHFPSKSQLTDIIILAISALQAAVGKEDGPGAALSRDHRLLAVMGTAGSNHWFCSRTAAARLAFQAVDLTPVPAKNARLQKF
jgi:hypothetical protein